LQAIAQYNGVHVCHVCGEDRSSIATVAAQRRVDHGIAMDDALAWTNHVVDGRTARVGPACNALPAHSSQPISAIFIRRSGSWLARAITSFIAPAFLTVVRMRTLAAMELQSMECTMSDVSTFRLYLMRATYLLVLVGLGVTVWPGIIQHAIAGDPKPGATPSLLAGVAVVAAFGIRYPLQMLPLFFFELIWKSIWLIAVALPLWSAHQMDAATWESVNACVMGIVIFPIAIPWSYAFANYVRKAGDRWK
jgi:hypothetical protein